MSEKIIKAVNEYFEFFNNQDAVLVNGNHFKTDRQVLIINEKKKEYPPDS